MPNNKIYTLRKF